MIRMTNDNIIDNKMNEPLHVDSTGKCFCLNAHALWKRKNIQKNFQRRNGHKGFSVKIYLILTERNDKKILINHFHRIFFEY